MGFRSMAFWLSLRAGAPEALMTFLAFVDA
jgi:hypothetical protein